MIGSTISHYRIVRKLGQGGMGVVYQAEDTRLQRPVALKFLSLDGVAANARTRFLREAQTAALIHHPHLCPVYDIGEADGQHFIAMAYLEGRTLSRMIAEGPLSVSVATDLAIQIASGLEAAHAHGIVHRDIKGGNVVVSSEGHASILDFGLALREGDARVTVAGSTLGTPVYMSPEQAQGLEVDHRTDIWSLGVLLFEMLTGHPPFRRENGLALIHAIVKDQAPATGAPEELDRIVQKALAKCPEDRWKSAGEMAARLRSAASPDQPTRTLLMPAAVDGSHPRRRRTLFAIALSVLVLVTALAFLLLRRRNPTLPKAKMIAVLPLDVIGGDQNTRAIADGVVETLTAKLTTLQQFHGELTVVPASEIRKRKIDSAEDAHRIYGANLAVTGSAQVLNNRIQFTASLVDAVKLTQISARIFDFDSGNPISLQEGAVNAVVSLLDLDLTPDARRGVSSGDTTAGGAYTDYLKGSGYLARFDIAGNVDRALTSFSNAIGQDPKYALAYAGLAEAQRWKALNTGDKYWAGKALDNATRAVALGENIAASHVTLGEIYSTAGRQEDAIREFQRALQLEPGDGEAYRGLAQTYAGLAKYTEAEAAYLKAVQNHPGDWSTHVLLGIFYFERGRDREAESEFLTAGKLTPGNESVYRNLAALYMHAGRYQDARDQLQITLRLAPSARSYSSLGLAYYYQGRMPEAASALETAVHLDARRYISWGNLGAVYRWMPGYEIQAKHAFEQAIRLGLKQLDVTPDDYGIRANLAEYWAKLKDPAKALDAIAKIPAAVRGDYVDRIALAYELTGHRDAAIALLASVSKTTTSFRLIQDDPDMKGLWSDSKLQRALAKGAL